MQHLVQKRGMFWWWLWHSLPVMSGAEEGVGDTMMHMLYICFCKKELSRARPR